MDINAAVLAIEKFLESHDGVRSAQVRPSGDDIDVIKVWAEVQALDPKAYAAVLETAIRGGVPEASKFRLAVRAESLDTRPIKKA